MVKIKHFIVFSFALFCVYAQQLTDLNNLTFSPLFVNISIETE